MLAGCGTLTLPQNAPSRSPLQTAQPIIQPVPPASPVAQTPATRATVSTSESATQTSAVVAPAQVTLPQSAQPPQQIVPAKTVAAVTSDDSKDKDEEKDKAQVKATTNTESEEQAAHSMDSALTKIQDNKIVIKTPSKTIKTPLDKPKSDIPSTSQSKDKTETSKVMAKAAPVAPKPVKSKQVDVKPTVVSEAEVKYSLANRYFQSGRFQNAIDVLESSEKNTPLKSKKLLLSAYLKLAQKLVKRKDYIESKNVLEKAAQLSPKNAEVKTSLTKVNNILESEKVFKLAMENNNSGNLEAAYLGFRRVLELNRNHPQASEYYKKTKDIVVTKHHKKALKLFRAQQLNAAIKEWEKLLQLDPENDLAKIYLSRAVEMRKRIKKL